MTAAALDPSVDDLRGTWRGRWRWALRWPSAGCTVDVVRGRRPVLPRDQGRWRLRATAREGRDLRAHRGHEPGCGSPSRRSLGPAYCGRGRSPAGTGRPAPRRPRSRRDVGALRCRSAMAPPRQPAASIPSSRGRRARQRPAARRSRVRLAVGGAVDHDLDDPDAVGHARDRRRQWPSRDSPGACRMPCARHSGRRGRFRWGCRRRARSRPHAPAPRLERGEDAAAVVVDDDQGEVGPRLVRADEQAVGVVQEGEVAEQGVGGGGRSPGRCRPPWRRTPSMPARPRLASTSSASARPRRGRRRAPGCETRTSTASPGGRVTRAGSGTRRGHWATGTVARQRHPRAPALRQLPLQPWASSGRAGQPRRRAPAGARRRRRGTGRATRPPPTTSTRRPGAAQQARRPRGTRVGRPTTTTRSGAWASSQSVGVSSSGPWGTASAGPRAPNGSATRGPRARRAHATAAARLAGSRRSPTTTRVRGTSATAVAGLGRPRAAGVVRTPGLPAVAPVERVGPTRLVGGHERLAQADVEVHRPGSPRVGAGRGGERAADRAAPERRRARTAHGGGEVAAIPMRARRRCRAARWSGWRRCRAARAGGRR